MEHPNDDNSRRISIHAPRTGSDQQARASLGQLNVFQSTLPARGATFYCGTGYIKQDISIHAPRTGSDLFAERQGFPGDVISIHAPRTGSDATGMHPFSAMRISIHAPRTGSDRAERSQRQHSSISIHAPRTGSDTRILIQLLQHNRFQSTLPARGATTARGTPRSGHPISIHAPRTGSDKRARSLLFTPRNFNPRSPHGERLGDEATAKAAQAFQSTLPARGATRRRSDGKGRTSISIHAPRTGSDSDPRFYPVIYGLFQSTLPARGATKPSRPCRYPGCPFQSTLPARGATQGLAGGRVLHAISIHAPRTGSDRRGLPKRRTGRISIHAPRTGSDSKSRT